MIEQKGFYVGNISIFIICNIILGILSALTVPFFDSIWQYIVIASLAMFLGWISFSTMDFFKASPEQSIISAVIGSSAAVFVITATLYILSSLGPMLMADDITTAEASNVPNLFGDIRFVTIILVSLVYLISYNFFTARTIYNAEPQRLKYYGFAAVAWIIAFLAAWLLSRVVLQGALSPAL